VAYCTVDSVKQYLGIDSSSDDNLIDTIVTRSQAVIDKYCTRTFAASADTTRYFDAVEDISGPYLWFGDDLASITTVTNGDSTTISSSDYVTEPRNKTPYSGIKLKAATGIIWTYTTSPENAISITGKWAYSATAPSDIEHACLVLAAWLYRYKDTINEGSDRPIVTADGVTILPSQLPRQVMQILRPYRRLM